MQMIGIGAQQRLIRFVVERLHVPRRSEPAGAARPVIIAIAIDHGATRSQEAAAVEWPSSRKSVAHQRRLRCMIGLAANCCRPQTRLFVIWDLKSSDDRFFVSRSSLPKTRKRVYDF